MAHISTVSPFLSRERSKLYEIMFFLSSSNSCKMQDGFDMAGIKVSKDRKNGIREKYLVHLDEKAVDKVSRV